MTPIARRGLCDEPPRLPRPGRRSASARSPWPRCSTASCRRRAAAPAGDRRACRGVVRRTSRPKAKRVIFLYMAGGPSHLETFDYKPKLAELDGQPMPESFTKGQPIAQLQGQKLKCLGPLTKFQQHGKSGQGISDFLPHIAKLADDICIVRSMHHRPDQPRPGPHVHEHRHGDLAAGRAWARGSPTAWAASATTCPASSC